MNILNKKDESKCYLELITTYNVALMPQCDYITSYATYFAKLEINDRGAFYKKVLENHIKIESYNFNKCDSYKSLLNALNNSNYIDNSWVKIAHNDDSYKLEDKVAVLTKIILPEYRVIISEGIGNAGNHDKGFDFLIVNPNNYHDIYAIDVKTSPGRTNVFKELTGKTLQVYENFSSFENARKKYGVRTFDTITLGNYIKAIVKLKYLIEERSLDQIHIDAQKMCSEFAKFF